MPREQASKQHHPVDFASAPVSRFLGGLDSCPRFLWWWAVMEKCKWRQALSSPSYFWFSCFITAVETQLRHWLRKNWAEPAWERLESRGRRQALQQLFFAGALLIGGKVSDRGGGRADSSQMLSRAHFSVPSEYKVFPQWNDSSFHFTHDPSFKDLFKVSYTLA